MKEHIRRDHLIDGKSIRQIARERHLSRNTIRAAIKDAGPTVYKRKKEPPAPVLGSFHAIVKQILKDDENRPKKQRHTCRRIWERLRDEHGFTGAESTVRGYIGRVRPSLRETYIPLEFDPGTDAQFDWGDVDVVLQGQQVKLQTFCMKLRASGAIFVCCFRNQKQEALFEGHVRAFEFFGGVPKRVTYDNPKTIVVKVLKGRNRVENEAFTTFRSTHLFESVFCKPGKEGAHEKGGVENLVGYARRNFFVPLPEVDSLDQLNDRLRELSIKHQERCNNQHKETIGDLLQREREALLALPTERYACCRRHEVKADSTALVSFETNRYSVPVAYAHKHLVLKAYVDHVVISHADKVIATHARCYERHEDIFNGVHYLPLLEKRPGAFHHARPLRKWHWAPVLDRYHAKLQTHVPDGRGTAEFIRILGLHQEFSAEAIEVAVELALEYRAFGYDALKNLLLQLNTPTESFKPLDMSDRDHLAQVLVGDFNPNQYAALIEGDVA